MDRWHSLPKFKRIIGIAAKPWLVPLVQHRPRSTATTEPTEPTNMHNKKHIHPILPGHQETLPPLSVMPTRMLLRTLMITWILSSPRLVNLSIPIMHRISYSSSWFLNPDRNPILHSTARGVFYDHFCAGENEKEVQKTIRNVKKLGFEGVILGFAKETLADKAIDVKATAAPGYIEDIVEQWKRGTLQTLAMLGPGDFLAVK